MPPMEGDFYRRLLAAAAVAVVATDRDFNVVCLNAPAERLFAVTQSEILGRSIGSLVPDSRRTLLGKLLNRTLEQGETTQLDFRQADADGNVRTLALVLSP